MDAMGRSYQASTYLRGTQWGKPRPVLYGGVWVSWDNQFQEVEGTYMFLYHMLLCCNHLTLFSTIWLKLYTATLDNMSNNTTLYEVVEALHYWWNLQWASKENQLPLVIQSCCPYWVTHILLYVFVGACRMLSTSEILTWWHISQKSLLWRQQLPFRSTTPHWPTTVC